MLFLHSDAFVMEVTRSVPAFPVLPKSAVSSLSAFSAPHRWLQVSKILVSAVLSVAVNSFRALQWVPEPVA